MMTIAPQEISVIENEESIIDRAQSCPNRQILNFMRRETIREQEFRSPNADSTVPEDYRAGSEFDIKYLEIPVKDLHVFDSRLGKPAMREHIYADKDEKMFRFFIHPESEELYKDLVTKYGVAGTYRAIATASARTLLAWNPTVLSSEPVFLKLSLNRRQSGLGRVVPDWEIRRSVLVSHLASLIPSEDSDKYGVSIIPELAGAYVNKDLIAGAYIDEKQHTVFQHGLIFRDTSFMKRFPKHQIYPLFALFAERDSREPLIVEWWREEYAKTRTDFEQFLIECIAEPLVRAVGYLVFEQGIIPESHAQNLVVAVNPKSRQIEHVFNRDIGSVKINFLLRWVKGWTIEPLRTHNIAYDFKPHKGNAIAGKPLLHWISDCIFGSRFGTAEVLKTYVPKYSTMKMYEAIQIQLAKALNEHMPEGVPTEPKSLDLNSVQRRVERYVRVHKPEIVFEHRETDREIFDRQYWLGQSMELPNAWFSGREIFDAGPLRTEYGIIYPNVVGKVHLAFLPPEDDGTKKPTRYKIEVSIDQLFTEAGSLSEIYGLPKKKTPTGRMRKTISVIKAGTNAEPYYQIIADHARAKRTLKQGRKRIQVEIIDDITELAPNIQKNILQQAYSGSSLLK